LCEQAVKALTDKMNEEEIDIREQAAGRGHSPASFGLSGDRIGLLTSTISDQLEVKLNAMRYTTNFDAVLIVVVFCRHK
jgi:hypothetical protein